MAAAAPAPEPKPSEFGYIDVTGFCVHNGFSRPGCSMCFDDRRLIGPKEEIEREATDLEGAGCDVSKFIRLPPTLPASWFYVSRDWVYGRDPEPYCTAKLMPMIAIFVAERSGHPLVCDECGEKHDHDGDAFSRVCCASFLLATLPTGTQLPPLNEVE